MYLMRGFGRRWWWAAGRVDGSRVLIMVVLPGDYYSLHRVTTTAHACIEGTRESGCWRCQLMNEHRRQLPWTVVCPPRWGWIGIYRGKDYDDRSSRLKKTLMMMKYVHDKPDLKLYKMNPFMLQAMDDMEHQNSPPRKKETTVMNTTMVRGVTGLCNSQVDRPLRYCWYIEHPS